MPETTLAPSDLKLKPLLASLLSLSPTNCFGSYKERKKEHKFCKEKKKKKGSGRENENEGVFGVRESLFFFFFFRERK